MKNYDGLIADLKQVANEIELDLNREYVDTAITAIQELQAEVAQWKCAAMHGEELSSKTEAA
jgi:thiamine monophosphate kinase